MHEGEPRVGRAFGVVPTEVVEALVRSAAAVNASIVGLWPMAYLPGWERIELVTPPPGRFAALDRLRTLGVELKTGCVVHGGSARTAACK